MKNNRKLKKAAAERAAAASDASQHLMHEATARAAVILGEAQKMATEVLTEAQKKAGPAAKEARIRTADFAAQRLDAWEPHIKDALDKVTPAVEAAREKVSDDLLPRLSGLLHDAAEHPTIKEVGRRGGATVAALKGEIEPARPKSKLKGFTKLLAVGAVVAGAVAAVRHFLAPKDDGWTAHEPSKAYVNNNDTFATAAKVAETAPTPTTTVGGVPSSDTGASSTGDLTDSDATPAASDTVEPEETASESQSDESRSDDAAQTETVSYGEGSYMGENPPEGFTIKGNERSKKYHVEGSAGYDRTIAEVWFSTEEAAQAAGFTKAQR